MSAKTATIAREISGSKVAAYILNSNEPRPVGHDRFCCNYNVTVINTVIRRRRVIVVVIRLL